LIVIDLCTVQLGSSKEETDQQIPTAARIMA